MDAICYEPNTRLSLQVHRLNQLLHYMITFLSFFRGENNLSVHCIETRSVRDRFGVNGTSKVIINLMENAGDNVNAFLSLYERNKCNYCYIWKDQQSELI